MRNSTPSEIDSVLASASAAGEMYGKLPGAARAAFLEAIASGLEALGAPLIETAMRETNLGQVRLEGERARTTGQLRMFANLIRSEQWRDIRIEEGDPSAQPRPKPDLRRTQVPLGPVAVFGASNFPLAFSVPGGDTASALAAGCPVVCKAHPSHPETSRLCADAILEAAQQTAMPEGVFGIVWGGPETGAALVKDPRIHAVGFTGSLKAGRALLDLAASRPCPIPVYAEMGSVNPVFLMEGALSARCESIAKGYADSLTLGVGQFCTNPGVVVGVANGDWERFLTLTATHLSRVEGSQMLNPSIAECYATGVSNREAHPSLEVLVSGSGSSPALFKVSGQEFLADHSLQEELFGPSGIAVECASRDEMLDVGRALEGQLTATIHFEPSDQARTAKLLAVLATKAGRLVANGFPTGVEVNSAMQHGGPYPATTDSRSTSVGTAAILRFVRPIAFQDFPAELLPGHFGL
ncbi:MAG: aldehyde dehydrogenase (NADP(+)) [Armatimonadetes bacterium]|nr:aldehyde dehydrogenase (NADP(+)) [Armatimonadota bacterium]